MEMWNFTVGRGAMGGCPPILVPSSLQRGFGDLAVLGGIWGEKWPEKKVSECVWGYSGVVFTMFLDGFDAFWTL